jgi:hypothetical protein
MSILSSTKTGKNGIEVNASLLEKYGYFLKEKHRDVFFFYKENKYIKLARYDGDFEFMIRVNNKYLSFNFIIKNVNDLILADKYLFSKHNSKEFKKYKKQILNIILKSLNQ